MPGSLRQKNLNLKLQATMTVVSLSLDFCFCHFISRSRLLMQAVRTAADRSHPREASESRGMVVSKKGVDRGEVGACTPVAVQGDVLTPHVFIQPVPSPRMRKAGRVAVQSAEERTTEKKKHTDCTCHLRLR
jgi:hypothetical protein